MILSVFDSPGKEFFNALPVWGWKDPYREIFQLISGWIAEQQKRKHGRIFSWTLECL